MPKTELTPELYDYCLQHGVREHPELHKLRMATNNLTNNQMLITPDQGAFMGLLARLLNVKKYLEIGVFTGYSALWMALSTASEAKVIGLDISDEHLALAQEHWQRAGVAAKITMNIAPAKNSLAQLLITETDSFDLAFIDANKSEYIDYYEYCLKLVKPGGLIIIDNVLMYGGVLAASPPKNYIKTLQKLNELIKNDNRVDICLLPIGDGMTLARKKDNLY